MKTRKITNPGSRPLAFDPYAPVTVALLAGASPGIRVAGLSRSAAGRVLAQGAGLQFRPLCGASARRSRSQATGGERIHELSYGGKRFGYNQYFPGARFAKANTPSHRPQPHDTAKRRSPIRLPPALDAAKFAREGARRLPAERSARSIRPRRPSNSARRRLGCGPIPNSIRSERHPRAFRWHPAAMSERKNCRSSGKSSCGQYVPAIKPKTENLPSSSAVALC